MISNRESMNNNNDHESIKDEQVRKNIQVLSARLYDLRERFMKIVQKINNDSTGFVDQTSEEDETTNKESNDEMSVDEEDNDSTRISSDDDNDEKQTQKSLIKTILERKARRFEYIKHVVQYPKIIKYLINDNPNCMYIPLRHLDPFIKEYVDKNPTGQIYDRINQQIQDIRLNYLRNCQ